MSEPRKSWPLNRREQELFASAAKDLPALELADWASRVLADVIERSPVRSADESDHSAKAFQHHAHWMMAIIGMRALRACMGVLSIGYEDQAVGYTRLLDEVHNRAQKVRADTSGNYAREWLVGRALGKGAKLAGQDFWEFMSGPLHANVRGVLDWLAISRDDGTTQVVMGPERRPENANATLVYMAGEARDLASMLANSVGVTPLDLPALTAAIERAYEKHIPGRS